jgi:hypothetical protein
MLGRHDLVPSCPDDEGGPVEGGQAPCGLWHEVGFRRDGEQGAHRVVADLGLVHDRLHPPERGGVAALGQPPERDRQPPEWPRPLRQ